MTKDEALKLALEALEESLYATTDKSQFLAFEAITAIKQARSAPVQEPVMEYPDYTPGVGWRNVTPPAAQLAPSQYGSPELQAMIVARAIEKDRAAQPAPVQEPVAVVGEDKHGPFVDWLGDRSSFYERNPVGTKFYTTPPAQPAVPLTDEEIDAKFDAFASKFDHESNEWLDMGADAYFRAGFRSAHGITVTPEKGGTP